MNLLDVCEALTKRALKRGATQAEVYGEQAESVSATIEASTLKGAQASSHEGFGVRVFVGTRAGFAFVNRRDGKALDEAIDDAIAIAKAAEEDPGNDLFDPTPARPIYGLSDARVRTMSIDDVTALAARLISAARREDKRAFIDSGDVSASHGTTAVANSRGLAVSYDDTGVQWGAFGMAADGDEVSSFDYAFDACRALDDVDVDVTGREFSRRVTALLRPRAGTTYTGPVMFSSEAFEEIFIGAILANVDGDSVWKGKSRLKDKLGTRIAAAGLTIVDDGTLAGAVGSARFDREGQPHRRTVIVGDGVLHRFLLDGRTAKRMSARPTGHAQGSARSAPGIGTTNLRVMPGERDDAALLRELKDGLYVTRFSGDVNEVSGDFSGVAKGSFLVRGGRVTRPVKETLIAGNVYDLLPRIIGLSCTLKRTMATIAPAALIDGVVVTAG